MVILVNKEFSNEALASNPSLDLRNVGVAVWSRLLSSCRAQDLRLYHITLKSLDGIEVLSETRELALEWATKIEQLDSVFQLLHLSKLSVYDFPKLRSLAGIEHLHELTELNLSGSRGAISPPLNLTTIEPITRIPTLFSFSLANVRLEDDDITCLANCSKLRHLYLSKHFDRRQFAFLAKRLNPQLETPLTSHITTNQPCKNCGERRYIFRGRRMPILCRTCDKEKFQKLEHEFEQLIHDA